jgi:predicted TIM-barrel fold metal-dependent hydrolase
MTGLKTIVGAGQIVYGTDYPFGSFAKHIAGLKESGFSAPELDGVFRKNALRLFPRFDA